MTELTPLLKASIGFAYVGGATFVAIGLILSFRRGRLHPLLLLCMSAIVWADSKAKSRLQSSLLSVGAFIVLGHAVYLSVFAPHLATKVLQLQTVGPTEPLFEGVPNQPL